MLRPNLQKSSVLVPVQTLSKMLVVIKALVLVKKPKTISSLMAEPCLVHATIYSSMSSPDIISFEIFYNLLNIVFRPINFLSWPIRFKGGHWIERTPHFNRYRYGRKKRVWIGLINKNDLSDFDLN